jgi:hypothetical protein
MPKAAKSMKLPTKSILEISFILRLKKRPERALRPDWPGKEYLRSHRGTCQGNLRPHTRARAHHQLNTVSRLLHCHGLGACATKPEVLDMPRPLTTSGYDLIRHVKYEDSPVPQVVQGLGAFRICAIADHIYLLLCATEFPVEDLSAAAMWNEPRRENTSCKKFARNTA